MKKVFLTVLCALFLGLTVAGCGENCPFKKKEASACPADCTKPCCAK